MTELKVVTKIRQTAPSTFIFAAFKGNLVEEPSRAIRAMETIGAGAMQTRVSRCAMLEYLAARMFEDDSFRHFVEEHYFETNKFDTCVAELHHLAPSVTVEEFRKLWRKYFKTWLSRVLYDKGEFVNNTAYVAARTCGLHLPILHSTLQEQFEKYSADFELADDLIPEKMNCQSVASPEVPKRDPKFLEGWEKPNRYAPAASGYSKNVPLSTDNPFAPLDSDEPENGSESDSDFDDDSDAESECSDSSDAQYDSFWKMLNDSFEKSVTSDQCLFFTFSPT